MTVATQLAVFYATESKILRRMVIPDDDAQLERLTVPAGESVLRMPLDRPHDEASCRAAIAAATGVAPPSGRCCVVDESEIVIAVCNADPALDAYPQGWLVANEQANPGDPHAGGALLRESRIAPT
jgi:hypothetical protein